MTSAVVLRLAEILRELAREHGRRDVRGERDDLRAVVVTRHRGRIVLIRRRADDAVMLRGDHERRDGVVIDDDAA